jgi:hypothetical protein
MSKIFSFSRTGSSLWGAGGFSSSYPEAMEKKDFVLLFVFTLLFLVNKIWAQFQTWVMKGTLDPDSDPNNTDHQKSPKFIGKLLKKNLGFFYSICSVVVPKGEI